MAAVWGMIAPKRAIVSSANAAHLPVNGFAASLITPHGFRGP